MTAGLFVAAAASQYLGSLLVAVSANGATTFVFASLLLIVVAALANGAPGIVGHSSVAAGRFAIGLTGAAATFSTGQPIPWASRCDRFP